MSDDNNVKSQNGPYDQGQGYPQNGPYGQGQGYPQNGPYDQGQGYPQNSPYGQGQGMPQNIASGNVYPGCQPASFYNDPQGYQQNYNPGNGTFRPVDGQPMNGGYQYQGQPVNGGYQYQGQPVNGGYQHQGQPVNGGYQHQGQPVNGGYPNNGQPVNGRYAAPVQESLADGPQRVGGRNTGRGTRNGGGLNPDHSGMRQNMAKKKKKKRKIGLFVFELVLLLILALGLFAFVKLGKIERVNLKDIVTNDGIVSESGFKTIVLYGVDSREGQLTKDSHSDAIIIAAMDKKSKAIRMASVYRDTYLDNTNGEYRKATECYYFGGPERSISMLNKNLDLNITDYVTINFNGVVKAVDLLGGIDLDITEEEVQYVNGYQVENSEVTGAEYTPISGAGYQHLNGNQTLAYCRIRYIGMDFQRTERQRTVLTKIFDEAKRQGVPKLLEIVDAMLGEVSTSMGTAEILALAGSIAGCSLGENTGFPFETAFADNEAGDCVVPVNLAANVSRLHAFLYGQEDYTPSDTVQQISNYISEHTGIY